MTLEISKSTKIDTPYFAPLKTVQFLYQTIFHQMHNLKDISGVRVDVNHPVQSGLYYLLHNFSAHFVGEDHRENRVWECDF